MIINPSPSVKTAKPAHITLRYSPVRDTSTPDTADITAAPKEYDSILQTVDYRQQRMLENAYSTPALVAEAPNTWKYKGR